MHANDLSFFFTRAQGNGAYLLQMHSGKVPVYCHMTSHGLGACGGGGWTLAMKIDGSKVFFKYLLLNTTCREIYNT